MAGAGVGDGRLPLLAGENISAQSTSTLRRFGLDEEDEARVALGGHGAVGAKALAPPTPASTASTLSGSTVIRRAGPLLTCMKAGQRWERVTRIELA